ncbi:MAG: alanine racemase [bacterium]|nr:alanine racemase [candidate division KSB1 bacterium]MDH7560669.1 alanine racemase [bacterium]
MRPTCAVIDLGAIAYNLGQIRAKVAPARIMAVVKANAYGHGALEVATTALASGASYLGVALVEEGMELRAGGVKAPILVFGGTVPEQAPLFVENDLTATVYTLQAAEALAGVARRLGKTATVHVKIDTGMGRVGVAWDEALSFLRWLTAQPGLRVEGVYTHLATSDEKDKAFAELQLARFRQVVDGVEAMGLRLIKHAANSGAILDMPESYFDMVRPGVMMYGYYPSPHTSQSVPLRPAMTFKTRVLLVKKVARGTSISYGRQFIAPRPTTIATLPVGYADGYNRLLSNRGEVLIRGRRYPVVGRVCMDQIMVDLGPESDVQPGEEVVLFGRQGDEEVSVYWICEKLGTIPYEVTCWVSARVPRVSTRGGPLNGDGDEQRA